MPKISQYSLYFPNPVRLEESPENLLSLVLVFCGEHVLQIVFQVVLRELCHNADIIFSVKKEVVWRAKKRASLRLWCPLLVYGFIGLPISYEPSLRSLR